METAKRYNSIPEIIELCDHLKRTPYHTLMKNFPLVEFWAAIQCHFRARYLVTRKSCLAMLEHPTELPQRITYVQDSESEARVFIEYFGEKLFKKAKKAHAIYSHVFYLHFTSPTQGIADELEITWMWGGNPSVCFTKNIPFTLNAAPEGMDTTLPSEERQGDWDIATCWIDPWIWNQVKNKRSSILSDLRHMSMEGIAENWPYLPGKEKRMPRFFKTM